MSCGEFISPNVSWKVLAPNSASTAASDFSALLKRKSIFVIIDTIQTHFTPLVTYCPGCAPPKSPLRYLVYPDTHSRCSTLRAAAPRKAPHTARGRCASARAGCPAGSPTTGYTPAPLLRPAAPPPPPGTLRPASPDIPPG